MLRTRVHEMAWPHFIASILGLLIVIVSSFSNLHCLKFEELLVLTKKCSASMRLSESLFYLVSREDRSATKLA